MQSAILAIENPSVRPSVCLTVRQHMQCSVKYTISERDEKDVCRLADALSLCGS